MLRLFLSQCYLLFFISYYFLSKLKMHRPLPRPAGRLTHAVSMMQLNNSCHQTAIGKGLYSALLSLGLDVESIGKKIGTPLTADVMTNLPKRVGDIILHHLFLCIDREKAMKLFRDIWPTLDKRREAQFYKAAFEWYKLLVQQDSSATNKSNHSLVVSRTVVTPSSHKFLSTLTTLVRIALKISIKKNGNCDHILHQPLFTPSSKSHNETAMKIIFAQTMEQRDKFCKLQQLSRCQVMRTNGSAKLCVKEYRSSVAECEELKMKLKEMASHFPEYAKVDLSALPLEEVKQSVVQKLENIDAANKPHWDRFEHLRESEEKSYKLLKPLVQANSQLSHMDASQLNVAMPQEAVRDFIKAGYELPNLYGGKNGSELDLVALLQTTHLSLQTMNASIALNCDDKQWGSDSSCSKESDSATNRQRGDSLRCCVSKLKEELQICRDELSAEITDRKVTSIVPRVKRDHSVALCPPSPPFSLNQSNENVSLNGEKASLIEVTPNTLRSAVFYEPKATSKRKLYDFSLPVSPFKELKPESTTDIQSGDVTLSSEMFTMDQRASHQRNKRMLQYSEKDSTQRIGTKNLPLSSRKYKVCSKLPTAALSRSCNKRNASLMLDQTLTKENDSNYANVKRTLKNGTTRDRKVEKMSWEKSKPKSEANESIDELASMVAKGMMEQTDTVDYNLAETLYMEASETFSQSHRETPKVTITPSRTSEMTLWTSAIGDISDRKSESKRSALQDKQWLYASPLLRKYPLPQDKSKDNLYTPKSAVKGEAYKNTKITPKQCANINLKYSPKMISDQSSPLASKVVDESHRVSSYSDNLEVEDIHGKTLKDANLFTPETSKTLRYKQLCNSIKKRNSSQCRDGDQLLEFITSPPCRKDKTLNDKLKETDSNLSALKKDTRKDVIDVCTYSDKASKLRLESKAHLNNLISYDGMSCDHSTVFSPSQPGTAKASRSLMDDLKLEKSDLFKSLLEDLDNDYTSIHGHYKDKATLKRTFDKVGDSLDEKKEQDSNYRSHKYNMETNPLPSIREATFEKTKTALDLDKWLNEFEQNNPQHSDWGDLGGRKEEKLIDFDSCGGDYRDSEFVDGSIVSSCLGLDIADHPPLESDPNQQSIFDTLTESVLMGECDASVLVQENAKIRIARESLCLSIRLSGEVSSGHKRRSSAASTKRLSQIFNERNCKGTPNEHDIMDISDSILMSTSFDSN